VTTQSPEPTEGTSVPPEAFERVKRERDEAKAQIAQAAQIGQQALLVDK